MMKSISIVIPVYNEEKNINNLYNEINIALNDVLNYEIIFVDDCSIDKSYSELKKIENKKNNIFVIQNSKNSGQSYSMHKGILNSNFETIVTLDADGQNNPNDIIRLVKNYFDSDYSLVGGIRKIRKDSIIKRYSSRIANKIRSLILKDKCIDTGCSLKVFDKKTFLEFPFFDGIHRFLPSLFENYDKHTLYLDVDHRSRIFGSSKYGTFGRMFKGILDIIKVKKIINNYKTNINNNKNNK